ALKSMSLGALTNDDLVALKQLTKEYASWDYSGRPVAFRERLDYDSFEPQRRILLKLAEERWHGFWGDYWRRRGVSDPKLLRALSPRDFWLRYHSGMEPAPGKQGDAHGGRISVDIHAITEARGFAYVIYQSAHRGLDSAAEEHFQVLRARWLNGEWRLVAFPKITAGLRRQLEAARTAR
ncbi:MAG: hypothetical protein ABJF10_17225, partial [Chthoniobacter sp.]|uniref:hypothetical protein n=1 Tax=Chthoniobacter sp. TaxID=2510640 RepID=UPI0032AA3E9B